MQVHLSSVPGTGLHDPYAILVLLLFCIGELWPSPVSPSLVCMPTRSLLWPLRYLPVHPFLCFALCGGEQSWLHRGSAALEGARQTRASPLVRVPTFCLLPAAVGHTARHHSASSGRLQHSACSPARPPVGSHLQRLQMASRPAGTPQSGSIPPAAGGGAASPMQQEQSCTT